MESDLRTVVYCPALHHWQDLVYEEIVKRMSMVKLRLVSPSPFVAGSLMASWYQILDHGL